MRSESVEMIVAVAVAVAGRRNGATHLWGEGVGGWGRRGGKRCWVCRGGVVVVVPAQFRSGKRERKLV